MQLSFRDPDGFVYRHGERILRYVYPHATGPLERFLTSDSAVKWMAQGILSPGEVLGSEALSELPQELQQRAAQGGIVMEHKPIPFVSYPYEWAPEMLYRAAELSLQLSRSAVAEGFRLKDATPYNIMFDGPKPVFIDLLSFEPREPTDPLWRPYAQFVRTFVYPLLANRYFGLRLDEMLLVHRDGLEPEQIWRLCPAWRRLLPPFLSSVTLPVLMSKEKQNGSGNNGYGKHRARDAEEAEFLLNSVLQRADRLLHGVEPQPGNGEGTQYTETGHTYTAAEMAAKEKLAAEILERCRPVSVLDIGCNTGQFSRIAIRSARRVVAIDHDPEVIGTLWKSAARENLDILPLVIDLGRPPGSCGWANREFPSFLERARGKFDCILMLALIHHLIVRERVPLDRILELASELTRRNVIVEYVDPTDSQFQRIARGREALHRDLTQEVFETAARSRFVIAGAWQITATRRLYWLQKGCA